MLKLAIALFVVGSVVSDDPQLNDCPNSLDEIQMQNELTLVCNAALVFSGTLMEAPTVTTEVQEVFGMVEETQVLTAKIKVLTQYKPFGVKEDVYEIVQSFPAAFGCPAHNIAADNTVYIFQAIQETNEKWELFPCEAWKTCLDAGVKAKLEQDDCPNVVQFPV